MKKPKKISPLKKHSKHDKIVNNYQTTKQNHLEKLATKMLNNDEKFSKLKEKEINNNILDLF
tara:strand:- start:367 stop:552 length:186 start_codon:yes stop_codon:yes gene_type:complete